jgi:hypothetical protein
VDELVSGVTIRFNVKNLKYRTSYRTISNDLKTKSMIRKRLEYTKRQRTPDIRRSNNKVHFIGKADYSRREKINIYNMLSQ